MPESHHLVARRADTFDALVDLAVIRRSPQPGVMTTLTGPSRSRLHAATTAFVNRVEPVRMVSEWRRIECSGGRHSGDCLGLCGGTRENLSTVAQTRRAENQGCTPGRVSPICMLGNPVCDTSSLAVQEVVASKFESQIMTLTLHPTPSMQCPAVANNS